MVFAKINKKDQSSINLRYFTPRLSENAHKKGVYFSGHFTQILKFY